MHPYTERTSRAIERATAGASEAALGRHPPGKWSAAEILEHLSLAYAGTVHAMNRCLEKGQPIGHRPSLKQRSVGLLVLGFGHFPPMNAPAPTVPKGLAPLDALRAVREQLVAMDAALAACEARFGPRVLIADHPILGGLTLPGWRRFHLQHTRHHAPQIVARIAGK